MVVAAVYIRAVQSLGLVPEMLRTDPGNETGVMAAAHCTLRQNADAHKYGTSVVTFSLHFYQLVGELSQTNG